MRPDGRARFVDNEAAGVQGGPSHEDIVQVLLQKGLNVEDADRNGWTSLVWALKGGHLSTARKLIDYGASAQHRDVQGNSPLLWPLKQGNLTMVQLLLDHGAVPWCGSWVATAAVRTAVVPRESLDSFLYESLGTSAEPSAVASTMEMGHSICCGQWIQRLDRLRCGGGAVDRLAPAAGAVLPMAVLAELLKNPARLVAKVRLPGLLLLLRVSILWCLLLLAARPARCEFSSYATWANYLCAVEGSDSSPFVQLLTDPQWPQLLMKQMVWRRSGVSSLTGAVVGCYFLMLALGFVGYLVSLVEGNLSQSPLLSDVNRALRAGHALGDSRTASTVSTAGSFRKQLQIQAGTVAPKPLPQAIRESLRYGLFRKDLLELLAEQRGFQGFLALCITAYSYWFCVEVAFHGYALLLSLVLSTCNVAEHLQQINCHIDLEEVPAPPEPTVPVASPAA
eukprot:Skav226789  [mRNA]  locus=scaffold8:363272:375002:- [translate_table: standard]